MKSTDTAFTISITTKNRQAMLAETRVERAAGVNSKASSLLIGLLLTNLRAAAPTWSIKKGARYRYYVSTSLVKGDGRINSMHRRFPTGNLENIVPERLRKLLPAAKICSTH